jgi:hypothetical protein
MEKLTGLRFVCAFHLNNDIFPAIIIALFLSPLPCRQSLQRGAITGHSRANYVKGSKQKHSEISIP